MHEWNAEVYHRISSPQLAWGLPVLERLRLEGHELVLDVGCGSGRLTEHLLDKLPAGRAVGVDRSMNMLMMARNVVKNSKGRLFLIEADASALPFRQTADVVFSTATFHWVLDHTTLFSSIFAALKSGGRLVAQCGGATNLDRIHGRCKRLIRTAAFENYFQDWSEPWEFADPPTTRSRLAQAGFVDIRTGLEPAPVTFVDAAAFSEFVEHVILRPFLSRMPGETARDRFIATITEQAAGDTPAFELDYWRLNIDARKP